MVTVDDKLLRKSASEGMDEFLQVFVDAIYKESGRPLTAEGMSKLNSDQITLLAYVMMRDEVMDGGFVQLIHNGLGGFIFRNPFAKAVREWGLHDLYKLVSKCHKYYSIYHEQIEADMSDDEFMALYEKCPEFDDFDDAFVENEEDFTRQIAEYVDGHISQFASIDNAENV